MTAQELIKQGKPAEALAALQAEVRANPNDGKLRVFLFQLLAILGQWERAANQLKVVTDQDATTLLMAQVCGPALAAENLREEIFAGKRSALILGEPEEWVGWLIQANKDFAEGDFAAARGLREKAFEAAPATSGTLNGEAFEWAADADQRFGPLIEAIVDGKYYWIPMSNLREIAIEPPEDLRDLVWLPAIITLAAGAQKVAFLPARYPGTEKSKDAAVLMGRKTEWEDRGDIQVGIGQRVLATSVTEIPIMEVRKLVFNIAVKAENIVGTGDAAKIAGG